MSPDQFKECDRGKKWCLGLCAPRRPRKSTKPHGFRGFEPQSIPSEIHSTGFSRKKIRAFLQILSNWPKRMNRPLSFCMEFRALENQKIPGRFGELPFRDPGFFFVLRNIVPRSGIFLRFAEQDRRILPLKRNNLCFAEHSSAIRDFSSVCGTLFRDLGFFLS